MDGAQSLAIGAIAISPSNPEIVYVGTGEPNFSLDIFFGVGVYRINNASEKLLFIRQIQTQYSWLRHQDLAVLPA